MINGANFSRAAETLNKVNSATICLPINPTTDTIASGISLYLGLSKLGKNVSLVCASDLAANTDITGIDKIQKTLGSGGDNLVISFPYSDGSIDKVTYNIEGNNFNLLIVPKEGYSKLDPSEVKYTYTGGKVDVIITIDAPTLDSLGELYTANHDQFKGRDILNIDRHLTNANFGTINLIEREASSTAELILGILHSLNLTFDANIATNLYAGILSSTNNFSSYSVSANTFEASAFLLKSGALKKNIGMQQSATPQMPIAKAQPPIGFKVEAQEVSRTPAFTMDESAPTNVNGESATEEAEMVAERIEKKEAKETPKDWLKPKIFKGRNLV